MIIGISGLAGTGKDTAADMLVRNHGFVKVSLADPIKRICRDVFAFTEDQLWGPSESRNAEDRRYPRYKQGDAFAVAMAAEGVDLSSLSSEEIAAIWKQKMGDEPLWLSPRYALQTLGTEWGRNCYDDIWVEYAVRVAKQLAKGTHVYDARTGLRTAQYADTNDLAAPTIGSKITFVSKIDVDLSWEPNPHTRPDPARVDFTIEAGDEVVVTAGPKDAGLMYYFYEVAHTKGKFWVSGGLFNAAIKLPTDVAIPDVRFRNEIAGLKKAGARLIRIRRPGYETPQWDHPSETEQMSIPDEEFDLVINNQETLADLAENISFILNNDILDHE